LENLTYPNKNLKNGNKYCRWKKLQTATIINFAAKLFATELIATTSNDFLVVGVKLFCSDV
jgi:hypothetical protein